MLDKCPDCGSPRRHSPNPELYAHFECYSMWENVDPPVRCGSQTWTCMDCCIASLTAENERLRTKADAAEAVIRAVEYSATIEIDYTSCGERCPLCDWARDHDDDCDIGLYWKKYPKQEPPHA